MTSEFLACRLRALEMSECEQGASEAQIDTSVDPDALTKEVGLALNLTRL